MTPDLQMLFQHIHRPADGTDPARQRQRRPAAGCHRGVGGQLTCAQLCSVRCAMLAWHGKGSCRALPCTDRNTLCPRTHPPCSSDAVNITSFSWSMPSAFTTGSSFAVSVLTRPGSIADFGTSTSDIMSAAWTPLLTATITTTNALAALPPLSEAVVVPPGGTVSFWFLFTDGTRPVRSATPKQSSGYNIYASTADGALAVSYAMQASAGGHASAAAWGWVQAWRGRQPTAVKAVRQPSRNFAVPSSQATSVTVANWGNQYAWPGTFEYSVCQTAAPASPPPPSPDVPEPPTEPTNPAPPPVLPGDCGPGTYSWRPGGEAQPGNADGGLFFDLIAGWAAG